MSERVEGTVVAAMPNALYRIALRDGRVILAHVASEARVAIIRVVPGEHVMVETAQYNPMHGRILARLSPRE